MPIKQYDFIKRGFVDGENPTAEPVCANNAQPDVDWTSPDDNLQCTFEGERFKEAHHNVLAHLLEQNWNNKLLFSGKYYTVLEMAVLVGDHTPIGNKFTEQVSGINQLD